MSVTVGFDTGKKYQIKTKDAFGTCGKKEEWREKKWETNNTESYLFTFVWLCKEDKKKLKGK